MSVTTVPSGEESAHRLLRIELRDRANRPFHLDVSATEALRLLNALREAERKHDLRSRSLEEQAEALYAARQWI